MRETAPYFQDVAPGPGPATAEWLETSDGLRIRAGHWTVKGARGTVLLFPGRTEYIEKYALTATELAARGFATVTLDWRGQGLSDRLLQDRRVGHVDAFPDYQNDVHALIDYAEAKHLPRPWYLLGHSMGGAIGLRAAMQGLAVNACAFTGPMWGIRISSLLRPVAWGLYYASGLTGQGHRLSPTTRYENYVEIEPFEDNTLTSDPDMYAMMRAQIAAHPELALGGPSLKWVGEALREANALAARPAPDLPCITFVGSDESIVVPEAMRTRMQTWPSGRLEVVEGGRHEVLMETPSIRNDVLDQIDVLFTSAARRPHPRQTA